MKEFNVADITAMMKDFKEAVKSVEEKYGVAINFGGGKYYKTKLELPKCTIMIKGDSNATADELLYGENLKYVFPSCADKIGKTFSISGFDYILIGLKTKRSNSKFVVKKVDDGKLYGYDKSFIDKML